MKLSLIFVIWTFVLQNSAWAADALDRMSLNQLRHYVETEAGPKDLSALAQRQFYFEVTNQHRSGADDYSHLQQTIARKIPNEFARPVFDLRFIFGETSAIDDQHSVGILGGTGPLSDANIMKLVLEKLNPSQLENGTMIHLFSLPPPRTTQEQIAGGISYSARLTRFVRHGYAEYFLASNTAHLNYNTIVKLSGSDAINHLPRMIADRIAAENNGRSILILGTGQARNGRLYESIFDEKHMPYAQLSGGEQDVLQTWIDRIKQGQISDKDRVELKDLIVRLGRSYQTPDLLLACTELPLGLGDLVQDLIDAGFHVYDSESMIANIIAEKTEA